MGLESNKSIYVVAGTPYDSNQGTEILCACGINATPIHISSCAEEQALLHADPATLLKRITLILEELMPQPIVVYCNSLSFALDWPRIRRSWNFRPVYDIRRHYREIMRRFSPLSVGIVAVDDITLRRMRDYLRDNGFSGQVHMNQSIDITRLLEHGKRPARQLSQQIGNLQSKGANIAVMGCTHYDLLTLRHTFSIPVYYPGISLLRKVVSDMQGNLNRISTDILLPGEMRGETEIEAHNRMEDS